LKIKLLNAVAIIVLSMMACTMEPSIAATQVPQATYTLYPTQIPPTQIPPSAVPTSVPARPSFSDILLSNGFTRTSFLDSQCTSSCAVYQYSSIGLAGVIYMNGNFSIGLQISTIYNADTQVNVAAAVIRAAFGIEATNWVADNYDASTKFTQYGTLSNSKVTMGVNFENGIPILLIFFQPITGF